MMSIHVVIGAIAFLSIVGAENPLGQVVSLLTDLSAKVKAEGEAEAKAFAEYSEWCDDTFSSKGFEIKTATTTIEKLDSTIAKLSGDLEVAASKISDLAAAVSSSEAQLSNATEIREGEASEFAASEKELVEVVDTLGRAITILEREMESKPGAFAQLAGHGLDGVLQSLDAIVNAASFSVKDKQKLAALIQSTQEDGELGAPSASVYESKSGSIVEVLEDLKEKAEEQLSEVRKAEVNAKHSYAMMKQSLKDQMAADSKDMEEVKANQAADTESKASAESELATTQADLKTTEEALATAKSTCTQVTADHESTVAAREEELNVIKEAIGVLQESTSGAVGQAYSLLQVQVTSSMHTRTDLAKSEVLALIKKLAKQHHSAALAQLASRIAAMARYASSTGEDPFAKVKGLIKDMIEKLQAEAGAEATEKAFCDEETSKSEASKSELESQIAKLTSKIDVASAKSSSLKGEVAELQDELATLAKEEAEMTKIRQETHASYVQVKADYEEGLTGVRKALVLLQDYYAKADEASFLQSGTDSIHSFMQQPAKPETHAAAAGSGTSIIGILEVVESDFATNLAKEESAEATAQDAFEKMEQENKITKATKSKDIEYKTKEATSLDKTIAELSADRETADSELSAVNEYLAKLTERCVAKPETYESRKARREAEIAGLKEALAILTETSFAQKGTARRKGNRVLRGGRLSAGV